jgi:hypothetical protein
MWVAGWTFDDVAVGTFGIKGVGNALGTLGTIDTSIDGAASKISLVIATQTGTWTGGAFTLYVECIDLSDSLVAGTVTLGS